MKLFVDTGAFIALTDADDENHKAAAAFYRNAREKGTRFVTSNFVVCETMNYLRARISHHIAVLFRESLKKSSFIEIVTVTPSIEDAAFTIFKRYADKDFSFTDCTSFSIMRFLKLKNGFAFDKHFEQFEDISRLP
jgi:predicted nucleic acid-binding protein